MSGAAAPGDGVPAALARTHDWFEHHSGWAPPDADTLAEWLADGVCRAPDDCLVTATTTCAHGLASWWMVLHELGDPAAGGGGSDRDAGSREPPRLGSAS